MLSLERTGLQSRKAKAAEYLTKKLQGRLALVEMVEKCIHSS